MKNAVLLAPYFLPRRRVGSWRPFKFAIHLREFGWEPHVITIQDSSAALTVKEKRLLEGIAVHELTPLFDFTSGSGSQLSNFETEIAPSGRSMLQPALDWIDKQFPADTWLPFFWLKFNQIIEIVEQIQPEVLWSTGDPWSGHWLGKRLCERFAVPWVADFRDPWTLGKVNLKNRSAFSAAIDKKIEAGVIGAASLATFTSKATKNLYARHYPAQANIMHTIYNAFDRELYNEPEPRQAPHIPGAKLELTVPELREEQSESDSQQEFNKANPQQAIFDESNLNLLFFGKFRRLSPAGPFIDILSEMKGRDVKAANRIKMHSFGPLSESDKKYAVQKGVFENFVRLQPIPAEKMLSVLPAADILWLSTDAGRKHIIPAKLWDYLAARRPVLSIAPNPEIAEILNETEAGEQFSKKERDDLIALLQHCVEAKGEAEKLPIRFNPDNAGINKYEAHHAAQSLAELFSFLHRHHSSGSQSE